MHFSLIRLKEHHGLPQTAIDSVVAGTKYLFDDFAEELKNRIENRLSESNPDVYQDVEGVWDSMPLPFDGIETEWLQNSFARNEFGIVVSPNRLKAILIAYFSLRRKPKRSAKPKRKHNNTCKN